MIYFLPLFFHLNTLRLLFVFTVASQPALVRSSLSRSFVSRTETGTHQKPASKVRVTFYESSKPLVVTSPEPSEFDQFYPQDLIMASPITDGHMPAFDRQLR